MKETVYWINDKLFSVLRESLVKGWKIMKKEISKIFLTKKETTFWISALQLIQKK